MRASTDLVVGFDSLNYGAARNVYAPVDGVDHVKVRRLPLEIAPPLQRREFGKIHVPLHRQACDVTHLWLRTAWTRRAWGASFSSAFPYVDGNKRPRLHGALAERILRDNCRFLIGISDHALVRLRSSLGEDRWHEVKHKVRLVPPHHAPGLRRAEYQVPDPHEPLELLFVGVTFFGKGGQAVLETFERLQAELNLRLTVVSPVSDQDYEGTPPYDADPAEVRRRLEQHPGIKWVERLSHEEVLQSMQETHIGLLPTLADTFGYVVLEFMGLGVPTVVSNVQALPEFTDAESNWVVDVPTDDRGVWIGRGPIAERRDRYHEARNSISKQLESILRQARANPGSLETKSRRSMERIATQFDASERSRQLRRVYAELL